MELSRSCGDRRVFPCENCKRAYLGLCRIVKFVIYWVLQVTLDDVISHVEENEGRIPQTRETATAMFEMLDSDNDGCVNVPHTFTPSTSACIGRQ